MRAIVLMIERDVVVINAKIYGKNGEVRCEQINFQIFSHFCTV